MSFERKQDVYMTNDEQLLISKVGINNVDTIKQWLSKQPHLPNISGRYLIYNTCFKQLQKS